MVLAISAQPQELAGVTKFLLACFFKTVLKIEYGVINVRPTDRPISCAVFLWSETQTAGSITVRFVSLAHDGRTITGSIPGFVVLW